MTTIFTVHGTGASGPEEGDRWWQKGSVFEKHLRELVESEDGTLLFRPTVWDGANSENSRRIAAHKLCGEMLQCEGKKESYCLIGHSHGGSVASSALLLAAQKRKNLPRLARWVTVGTPFINSQKAFFLFARLGILRKSAYISVFQACLMSFVALLGYGGTATQYVYIGILIMTPLLLFYLAMWFTLQTRDFIYRPKVKRLADETFRSRWIGLFHQNDEAIDGLKSVKGLNIPFFAENFAVPSLLFGSLFVLPLASLYIASSESLMLYIFKNFAPESTFNYFLSVKRQNLGGRQAIGSRPNLTHVKRCASL